MKIISIITVTFIMVVIACSSYQSRCYIVLRVFIIETLSSLLLPLIVGRDEEKHDMVSLHHVTRIV